MACIQHTPPRRTWLDPDDAAEVADRWEADRLHDLELSERLGRELLRWLGLVVVLLGFAACAPEPECRVHPNAEVERAWCPDTLPTVRVVVDPAEGGCSVETVREAVALWSPATDGWAIDLGRMPKPGAEAYATVYVTRGSLAAYGDGRVGNTTSYHHGAVMDWARVVVEACGVQTLGHELGHALGFAHSADDHDLMTPELWSESWDVPVEIFGAMDRAQGLVSP